jgi:hypothetical protein
MNNWILVEEIQPVVNEYEHYAGTHFITVSYWDGTFDDRNGKRFYKFPDEQDEQPGFYYPSHWMSLPPFPILSQSSKTI